MAKRLTKLVVTEVSAVDRGAAMGARVVLMKRDAHQLLEGDKAGQWDVVGPDNEVVGPFETKREARAECDRLNAAARDGVARVDDLDARVARAKAEIAADKVAAAAALAAVGKTTESNMQTETIDIAKAVTILAKFTDRVDQIARANFISHEGAMMKLASTSYLVNAADAALWQDYRIAKQLVSDNQPAPIAAPVQVAGPAFSAMAKRVDALMKRDPTIRSRESAIAKVASSTAPADVALWQQYKHEGMGIDTAPVTKGELAPGELRNLAFLNLCGAIAASYPELSVEQIRSWARKVQAKGPPKDALQLSRDAA